MDAVVSGALLGIIFCIIYKAVDLLFCREDRQRAIAESLQRLARVQSLADKFALSERQVERALHICNGNFPSLEIEQLYGDALENRHDVSTWRDTFDKFIARRAVAPRSHKREAELV